MEIRFVLPEEVEQLKRNVLTAFPSKTPESLLRNMPGELVTPDEGRYIGCFDDDGTLIGSVLFMDFDINVRGKQIHMGAPAYVSVNFLHKKEHIARDMLRVLMGFYAKQGTALSCLHPFNPAFYNKMGYGLCHELDMWQPKCSGIRSFGDKSDLFYVDNDEERAEVLAYYRAWAKRTHGATIHDYMDPVRIFKDYPYCIGCRRGGRLTGYLTFEFVDVDHYTDMYHDLAVHEMLYDDIDTLREFMTFFASEFDQIDRVRIYSHEPSLHLMFANPDSGENRVQDGCIQEMTRHALGYMARIIDIRRYFELENFCEAPVSRDFILHLNVRDDFMSSNNGDFYLKVFGDQVQLIGETKADVTLTTGIDTLSSFVMGAVPLRDFLHFDRMQLSDLSYLDDVQKAIGFSRKPQDYTYF